MLQKSRTRVHSSSCKVRAEILCQLSVFDSFTPSPSMNSLTAWEREEWSDQRKSTQLDWKQCKTKGLPAVATQRDTA
jgi:hypothetical protein